MGIELMRARILTGCGIKKYVGCGIKKYAGRGIEKLTEKEKELGEGLLQSFQEDKSADSANVYNEKQLNATMRKVIRNVKKMSLKPIDTRVLLKS